MCDLRFPSFLKFMIFHTLQHLFLLQEKERKKSGEKKHVSCGLMSIVGRCNDCQNPLESVKDSEMDVDLFLKQNKIKQLYKNKMYSLYNIDSFK